MFGRTSEIEYNLPISRVRCVCQMVKFLNGPGKGGLHWLPPFIYSLHVP